jgi:hypothetical protein
MGSVGFKQEADISPQTPLLVFVNCPVADKRRRAAAKPVLLQEYLAQPQFLPGRG